ncbi:hypothetical protein FNU76_19590 [Chitinimonas arctica]|uniref:Uncharacterized protein n=1 Tax=Chitinimonas arctica TaxID=2594795 RepID=A0A516SJQ2_9NEIS|nr:hypothetical protein [Chitinimonas arctica]QDQ28377.1 hypothetical protein FNU76_19590 [Chitinimonas arctica]
MNWNRAFTDRIRNGRPSYWGNWTLNPKLKTGAVGFVSPDSGEFTLVNETTPELRISHRDVPNQWSLYSNNVHRTEVNAALDGSAMDPDTGAKITAGVEVKWEFSAAGAIASEFSISLEEFVSDLTTLSKPEVFNWLAAHAKHINMGTDTQISQGFGVVTSVIYARSGLNVGSEESGSSFSLTGSAGAVQDMLGGVQGKGAFLSTRHNKNIDQHLWPHQAGARVKGVVPIAYTFASYDGNLLIPNWTGRLGAFEILFNNKLGCSYITHIQLRYDTPQGAYNEAFTLTGGLSKTVGNIPLNASNIHVEVKFQGVANSDKYSFHWPTPLGQWLTGRRELELSGVWPMKTQAREIG